MSYIRKVEPEYVEAMAGGPGKVYKRSIIRGPEDLHGSGRLFAHMLLEKDCGVGEHTHDGDYELYYLLSGEAEYTDNGKTVTLHPGDITYTGSGESHGIVNRKDTPCEFIAIILYNEQKAH